MTTTEEREGLPFPSVLLDEHADQVFVAHGEQILSHADVTPLRAQDPRPNSNALVDDVMPGGRMGPLAILRFVTKCRRPHGDDFGLLRGQSLTVALGENDLAAGDGLCGFDGFHEADATGGEVVHDPI